LFLKIKFQKSIILSLSLSFSMLINNNQPDRFQRSDCKIDDLALLTQQQSSLEDFPLAQAAAKGVPVYDCAVLRQSLANDTLGRHALMAEWVQVWQSGPGIVVLKGLYNDANLIDEATASFQQLIAVEKKQGTGADHFAKPGANDRVWNALEKHCLLSPENFAHYYSNDLLALVCLAWLGPAYQITSQINCVNPGGSAQMAHRDYHLGFLSAQQGAQYPEHVHMYSPYLTLQGAIAHVDMPLESGPTLYLPHSQKFAHGYLAAGNPVFQTFFDANHIQLPLQKGDAVFFNPALMHAAGTNKSSDIYRLANLLQVSCAFGRAMESVDRVRMASSLYPTLLDLQSSGVLSTEQLAKAVAASAEGYAFPTNLDRDPPTGGLAPESQQGMMLRALQERWSVEAFEQAQQAMAYKKLT
jgi:ectoine hydroxylase-related dioxygenase (phytanoyl-CoA dioxygenase family)